MAVGRDRRAQAQAIRRRGVKLSLLSLFTFGVGGWFAVKKPFLGVFVIVVQGISFLLMFLGIGFITFAIVWFGSSIYMRFYPTLARVGTVFDRLEDEADYREQLEGGSAGAV